MSYKKVENGLFISFEGGEGAGKTSQINKLAERLTEKGYKVITTREPGGTKEGEALRTLLVQRESGNWEPMAEVLMLYADRIMHMKRVIMPALKDGKVVISDRFADSTLAYQGYGYEESLKQIQALHEIVMDGFSADLTLILDIDVAEGIKRSTKRMASEEFGYKQTEDRFERMDLAFHERIRQGFLNIAEQNPKRCHVIDAARETDVIAQDIEEVVLKSL